jgi:hypothetical protein
MCASNTVALCKSNGKDNLNPYRHGMAEARQVMRELAFSGNGLSLAKYLLISCPPFPLEPLFETNASVKGLRLRGFP